MSTHNKTDLPKKVILSGADCFHLVLDKHAKKYGAGGNVMRKVFYFEHSISFSKIEGILKNSAIIYWLCNIKLVQPGFFKAPYWNYSNNQQEIIIQEHQSLIEKEIPESILLRDISIESKRFVEADIVQYPSGGSAFILSWNHILLDAKGTTLLFEHLNHIGVGKTINTSLFFPIEEKKTSILSYIQNMYKVKNFVQGSSKPPISSVASAKSKMDDGKTLTKIISFSAEETKRIEENAFQSGARFGPNLFYIAACSHIIHAINQQRNNVGTLWLPVPYDGRLRGADGPMISNCVSFLFYRIPKNELDNMPQTVKCLSTQMTTQIKDGIPKKYALFLNMMRHIPLWLYYFLISSTSKGIFASFLYTSTGDNFNEMNTLFGEPISSINMIPALTFPPGLTFVFLKHRGSLHVNITYAASIIKNDDLVFIDKKLKEILLNHH